MPSNLAVFLRSGLAAAILSTGLALPAAAADKTLTVYTYESFVSEWGPGPKVKEAFEKTCACTVEFVGVADGVALRTWREDPRSAVDGLIDGLLSRPLKAERV